MENDMIERVTKAIRAHIKVDASGLAPAVVAHFVLGFEEAARAAIEEMREPSPTMLTASRRYRAKATNPTGPGTYRAMIDAALAPSPTVQG